MNGKTMIENGGRTGSKTGSEEIGGGHIALGALGDRILDVLALVCVRARSI